MESLIGDDLLLPVLDKILWQKTESIVNILKYNPILANNFILYLLQKHLTITEKIGLPDNLTVNHAYLQKLAQNGQSEYIPPENPEKSYNIKSLLGLVAPPSTNEAMLQKILEILEAQGIEQEKDLLDHIDEVVKVNPGMFGMSIDVNALIRKLRRNHKVGK